MYSIIHTITPAPKHMATKLEKFERLAERRVNETLKKLHLIGNLANKNNYSYTDAHAEQLICAIEKEVKVLKEKFRGKPSKSESFAFKSQRSKT